MSELPFPDEKQRKLQDDLLSHGILFPPDFKDMLRSLILDSMRDMDYRHIQGAQLLTGHATENLGLATCTGTSYAPLTPPIKITGLADGKYIFFWGGELQAAANSHTVNLRINGVDPANDNEAAVALRSTSGMIRMVEVELSNSNNSTVEMVSKSADPSSQGMLSTWFAYLRLRG